MYEDINERLEAATSKAEDASGIMHDVANGSENEYVTTESGEVPTIPEFLRLVDVEINEGVDSILTEVNQAKDDTEQLKQDTQQILDDTEQVAIEVSDNKDITDQNVTESTNQATIATNAANSASSDSAAVSQIKTDVEQIAVDVGNDASQVSSDKDAVTLLKQESEDSAELSRKWAEGETVSGDTPSDTNNSKYWSDLANQYSSRALSWGGVFTPTSGQEYPVPLVDEQDSQYSIKVTDGDDYYTFTTGELAGQIAYTGMTLIYDFTVPDTATWVLLRSGVGTVNSVNTIVPDVTGNVTLNSSDFADIYSKTEVDTKVDLKQDSSTASTLVEEGSAISVPIIAEADLPSFPNKAMFAYVPELKVFYGFNPETGEWGEVGGGGIPAFITKTADFIVEPNKAYQVDTSDDLTKNITITLDDFLVGQWFAIKAYKPTGTENVLINLVGNAGDWVDFPTADTVFIPANTNSVWYVQKSSDGWSIVNAAGESYDGAYIMQRLSELETEVSELQSDVDQSKQIYQTELVSSYLDSPITCKRIGNTVSVYTPSVTTVTQAWSRGTPLVNIPSGYTPSGTLWFIPRCPNINPASDSFNIVQSGGMQAYTDNPTVGGVLGVTFTYLTNDPYPVGDEI